MSKSMIEAFAKAQMSTINLTTKDRLKYTVAGCKDGCLYSLDGTNYGLFDNDAPDTEFITEDELKLTRITTTRIESITKKMNDFFAEYGANPTHKDVAEVTEDIVEENPDAEEKGEVVEPQNDEDVVDETIDAIKKAIKKGKFKKAQKMIDDIGGHKKLQKKLDKAQ